MFDLLKQYLGYILSPNPLGFPHNNDCEIDYQHFSYVAEFWNSITNFCYLFFGALGLTWIHRLKNHYPLSQKNRNLLLKFAKLFPWCFICGLSSLFFHSTLLTVFIGFDYQAIIWCLGSYLMTVAPSFQEDAAPRRGPAWTKFIFFWLAKFSKYAPHLTILLSLVAFIGIEFRIFSYAVLMGLSVVVFSAKALQTHFVLYGTRYKTATGANAANKLKNGIYGMYWTGVLGFGVAAFFIIVDREWCHVWWIQWMIQHLYGLTPHPFWHILSSYCQYLLFTGTLAMQMVVQDRTDAVSSVEIHWLLGAIPVLKARKNTV